MPMDQQMLFSVVKDWCDRNDWAYQVVEAGVALRSGFSGENGQFTLYFSTTNGRLMVRSLAPNNVPEAKRGLMAEFLAKANYGLAIGNFEMDFSDGEVSYKTSTTTGDAPIADWLLQDLVYINCLMMDKYFPAMMQVLYSSVDPESALEALDD